MIWRFRVTDGVLGRSARKISDGQGLNVNDCAEISVAGGGRPEPRSQQGGITTTGLRAGGHT
jgi:hypothetical protein